MWDRVKELRDGTFWSFLTISTDILSRGPFGARINRAGKRWNWKIRFKLAERERQYWDNQIGL